ncbi:spore germination protein KA/spore germination protein/spore germination protein [Hydrogenispora ethanolica]|uniref:Spore germination protein KA/spore germination protein/spore germination protein n=1 Tax=Hydrogenispora ethanolica TaxID=1082276 RepID=A0A4R1QWK5_HYDET|nr:spore germination protein [Hydrogenispora ethanolica]TCL57873.1 spore germination protein KA/spore germination protein/spore germination protein [Hydrogenispora ethanolica]
MNKDPSPDALINFISGLGYKPIDLEVRSVVAADHSLTHLVFRKGLADPAILTDTLSQAPKLSRQSFAPFGEVLVYEEASRLTEAMNQGATIVFLEDHQPFAVLTPAWVKRPPGEPLIERSIRGSYHAFTEDIFDNLAVVRKVLPDANLVAEELAIGQRTRTKTALAYLQDVANPDLVQEVRLRLARLRIDAVLDCGVVEELIQDYPWTPFPLNQSTERPDKVAGYLLEGRVAVFIDNCPRAIVLPVSLNDLYQSPDDYYFNFWSGSMIRIVRFVGSLIAVALSGLYIALVGASPQLLPITLGLEIAGLRVGMPLPLPMEVILTELMVELFREAGLRLPGGINVSMGVSTGILLGLALVMTGYISTPTIIVVGLTAIASFSTPNFSVGFTWRVLKYFLILAATFLGYYGFILGAVLILAHVASLTSFGSAYASPWGPFQLSGVPDSLIRFPHRLRKKRPSVAKPLQQTRQQNSGEE